MSEEFSKKIRDLLQLCSNQLYVDENGLVKQKKIIKELEFMIKNND